MRFVKPSIPGVIVLGWLAFGMQNADADTLDANERKVLETWIRHQAGLRTLSARFVQTRSFRSLRFPVRKKGRVWFGTDQRFRWQIGDPVVFLAIGVRKRLVLSEPQKKRARIQSAFETGGGGFGAISIPFTTSVEDFLSRFHLRKLSIKGTMAELVVTPRDREVAVRLRKTRIVFELETGYVKTFEMEFADGSSIKTELFEIEVNTSFPDELFVADLDGYRVDDRQRENPVNR